MTENRNRWISYICALIVRTVRNELHWQPRTLRVDQSVTAPGWAEVYNCLDEQNAKHLAVVNRWKHAGNWTLSIDRSELVVAPSDKDLDLGIESIVMSSAVVGDEVKIQQETVDKVVYNLRMTLQQVIKEQLGNSAPPVTDPDWRTITA